MNAKPRTITANGVKQVLVVDDHPVVRKGLIEMINEDGGFQVCAEAEDFNNALKAVKEQEPDIAVVDINLKGISGLELIKQLRVSHSDLKILVLSMHDEKLYAERSLRAGALGYIMKQEGSSRLITALRTIMNGEIYVSEAMSTRMLNKLIAGKPDDGGSPLERLSDRELEVFELLGRGRSTRQIAEQLCISIKTVESHREHIKQKLNIKNASELVQNATQWVMREGID